MIMELGNKSLFRRRTLSRFLGGLESSPASLIAPLECPIIGELLAPCRGRVPPRRNNRFVLSSRLAFSQYPGSSTRIASASSGSEVGTSSSCRYAFSSDITGQDKGSEGRKKEVERKHGRERKSRVAREQFAIAPSRGLVSLSELGDGSFFFPPHRSTPYTVSLRVDLYLGIYFSHLDLA